MSWIRIRIRISPDESGSGFDFYHTNPDPRIRTQIRIAACKCIFSSLFVKHVDSKSALHVKSAHQTEAFFQDFFFPAELPGQDSDAINRLCCCNSAERLLFKWIG